jgi:hypothetical protein
MEGDRAVKASRVWRKVRGPEKGPRNSYGAHSNVLSSDRIAAASGPVHVRPHFTIVLVKARLGYA